MWPSLFVIVTFTFLGCTKSVTEYPKDWEPRLQVQAKQGCPDISGRYLSVATTPGPSPAPQISLYEIFGLEPDQNQFDGQRVKTARYVSIEQKDSTFVVQGQNRSKISVTRTFSQPAGEFFCVRGTMEVIMAPTWEFWQQWPTFTPGVYRKQFALGLASSGKHLIVERKTFEFLLIFDPLFHIGFHEKNDWIRYPKIRE